MTTENILPALEPLTVPLADLVLDPANARIHSPRNLETIKGSLQKFGQHRPAIVQRQGMVVRVGNGMVEAARSLGWTRIAAIVVDESDVEATARAIADNRTSDLSSFDSEILGSHLRALKLEGFDLSFVGFDPKEFEPLVESAEFGEVHAGDTVDDQGPAEPPSEPVTVRGDLWILDAHRILCGDSTNGADVALLMNGERAGLMNTDPPYGVSYANDERPNPGVAKPRVANDLLEDERLQEFLEAVFRIAVESALAPNAAWYLWHAHLTQGYFAAAAAAANVVLHRQIIWVKPVLLLGRGHYHWKHEPCFMGWVEGHQPPDYGLGHGERTQTTVWEIGSVTSAERKEFDHSTPKPTGLFEIPIVKHLRVGEICYEPFSGSGPQIIAAEKLKRRCYAMEIEPRYVDVALRRWERSTGKKAVHEDGRSFLDVAVERGVVVAEKTE